MLRSLKKAALGGVNGALGSLGWQLARRKQNSHDWSDVKQFIPFEETLAGAKAAGLSVGDYINARHNVPGASQDTHDRVAALGVFQLPINRACEIGPGSGRFLEKTINTCKPAHYEIYETAGPWQQWLVDTYKVTAFPTDGATGPLWRTPRPIRLDLPQAHKVFIVCLFLTTLQLLHRNGSRDQTGRLACVRRAMIWSLYG